jgi:cytoskeleton protein RodZ
LNVNSQGDLHVPSFGAQLRQERERQGVSLEDISLTTKIATRMLRALEDEHFDQLPGGIFNKGFIRAYARCLHMDEDQAVADYLVATGAGPLATKSEDDDQTPILEPPSREGEPTTPAGLPWGTLAVVLLIAALGFAAWGFYSRESESAQQDSQPPATTQATANPQSTAPPATTEPSTPESKPTEPADSPATAAKPTEKPTEPPPAKPAETEPPSPQAATTPPPAASTTQPQPTLPTNGTFVVVVKAREDSWLSISVDGEIVTRALLAAPAQRTVRAQNEIVVRVGNAGALDFEFNGQKLPTQGDYGEAKTLIFTPRGLQSPTPKPQPPTQSP